MTFLDARIRAGLTQQEASRKIGVSQEAISQWESGKTTPRTSILPKISEVYSCSIDELLINPL